MLDTCLFTLLFLSSKAEPLLQALLIMLSSAGLCVLVRASSELVCLGFDALWPSSSSSSSAVDLKATLRAPIFFTLTLSILTGSLLVHLSGDASAARRAKGRHERAGMIAPRRSESDQIMESESETQSSREREKTSREFTSAVLKLKGHPRHFAFLIDCRSLI